MARTLEELRERYNSSQKGNERRHIPMGPRGGPMRRDLSMRGKPKNIKKTVKRLLSYVGEHKLKLALVFFTAGAEFSYTKSE